MAHSKQAKKRIRQNERTRVLNKSIASSMRTEVKRILQLAEQGDKEAAQAALPHANKVVDKAARARVIHPNTAARRKSVLARAINRIGAAS